MTPPERLPHDRGDAVLQAWGVPEVLPVSLVVMARRVEDAEAEVPEGRPTSMTSLVTCPPGVFSVIAVFLPLPRRPLLLVSLLNRVDLPTFG